MANSNYTLQGNQLQQLEEQVDSSISIDENLVAVATVTFKVKWNRALALSLQQSRHPEFPSLIRDKVDIKREAPDWALVTINYKGVVSTGTGDDRIVKRYSLQAATASEPIETHEDFEVFGGKPIKGKGKTNAKGAVFDDKGKFTGFAMQDLEATPPLDYYGEDPNHNLAGTRSYLSPGAVYVETTTYNEEAANGGSTNAVLDLKRLGKIDTPPDSKLLPSISGSARSWLLIAVTATETGNGLQVVRKWKISGRRGWNKKVYDTAAAS